MFGDFDTKSYIIGDQCVLINLTLNVINFDLL